MTCALLHAYKAQRMAYTGSNVYLRELYWDIPMAGNTAELLLDLNKNTDYTVDETFTNSSTDTTTAAAITTPYTTIGNSVNNTELILSNS